MSRTPSVVSRRVAARRPVSLPVPEVRRHREHERICAHVAQVHPATEATTQGGRVKPYRITSRDCGATWQATVHGVRQRPDFNSRGAAVAFAAAVAAGKRKPEPKGAAC